MAGQSKREREMEGRNKNKSEWRRVRRDGLKETEPVKGMGWIYIFTVNYLCVCVCVCVCMCVCVDMCLLSQAHYPPGLVV